MKIDGVAYSVGELRPVSRRAAQVVDTVTAGILQSGREICDAIGVKYDFEMVIEPRQDNDYDEFYLDVTKPLNPRIVSLPFGQTVLTFPAKLMVDGDYLRGTAGRNRWGGLKLRVVAMESARDA